MTDSSANLWMWPHTLEATTQQAIDNMALSDDTDDCALWSWNAAAALTRDPRTHDRLQRFIETHIRRAPRAMTLALADVFELTPANADDDDELTT